MFVGVMHVCYPNMQPEASHCIAWQHAKGVAKWPYVRSIGKGKTKFLNESKRHSNMRSLLHLSVWQHTKGGMQQSCKQSAGSGGDQPLQQMEPL